MSNLELSLLKETTWFLFLTPKQQVQAELAIKLYQREVEQHTDFVDYSYIVFMMAKVYEGFLKRYFLQLGLISKDQYYDRRFRIGRALNPDVSQRHQDEHWLFDDVAHECGEDVARQLWETWLKSRNHIFHFFPDKDDSLSLSEAREHMEKITQAMDDAVRCKYETAAVLVDDLQHD